MSKAFFLKTNFDFTIGRIISQSVTYNLVKLTFDDIINV